jgi:heme oxygenase
MSRAKNILYDDATGVYFEKSALGAGSIRLVQEGEGATTENRSAVKLDLSPESVAALMAANDGEDGEAGDGLIAALAAFLSPEEDAAEPVKAAEPKTAKS